MRKDLLPHRAVLLFPTRSFATFCGCAALCVITAYTQAPTQSATAPSLPSAQSQAPTLQPDQSLKAPQSDRDTPAALPTPSASAPFTAEPVKGELKEDQLKQLLVGKTLYLRGCYLDNNLDFDEFGKLRGHSARGSYTLSQIQINKIKLSKHKLELEGDRYALHFLGADPYEDPTIATDRVRITPKKKVVHIWIEREEIEKPKKEKNKDKESRKPSEKKLADKAHEDPALQTRSSDPKLEPLQPSRDKHGSDDKRKAASEAQSNHLLLAALDSVFSRGIDDRMVGGMPPLWKVYFEDAHTRTKYPPADPGVLRQSDVDEKAKLISVLDPPSNEFAQKNGIAGVALYHAIVGADGKVNEIVAGRPIGFGLDENAEQAIRNAVFQPAMKGGKAVPVALDLVVSFRIYSKRTSQPAAQEASDKPDQPALPGPYTLQDLKAQTPPQTQTAAPPQSQQ